MKTDYKKGRPVKDEHLQLNNYLHALKPGEQVYVAKEVDKIFNVQRVAGSLSRSSKKHGYRLQVRTMGNGDKQVTCIKDQKASTIWLSRRLTYNYNTFNHGDQ